MQHYPKHHIMPLRSLEKGQQQKPQTAQSLIFLDKYNSINKYWYEMRQKETGRWSLYEMSQRGISGANLSQKILMGNVSFTMALEEAMKREDRALSSNAQTTHASILDMHLSEPIIHLNYLANLHGYKRDKNSTLTSINAAFTGMHLMDGAPLLKDPEFLEDIAYYTQKTTTDIILEIAQPAAHMQTLEQAFILLTLQGQTTEAFKVASYNKALFRDRCLNPYDLLPHFLDDLQQAEKFLEISAPLPDILKNRNWIKEQLVGKGNKLKECLVTRLARTGETTKLKNLLQLGAPVMGSETAKNSPIIEAIANKQTQSLKILLSYGAADYKLKRHNKLLYWNAYLNELLQQKQHQALNLIIEANPSLLQLGVRSNLRLADFMVDKATPETKEIIEKALQDKSSPPLQNRKRPPQLSMKGPN